MKRRLLSFLAAAAILLSGIPAAQAAAFTDIEGHWAQEQIERAVDLGLFSGVSDTEFNPDGKLTRAMFVVVLAKYSGYDADAYTSSTFRDVPKGSWYAAAVEWAVQNGVVSGTSKNTFAPNQVITREQIAVILVNYANYTGTVLPRIRNGKLFADSGRCANYALDAVYTLYRSGIISGVGSNRFDPTGSATRAQCAVILCSYIDACAAGYTDSEQVELVNHRGYNTEAPENTLPAYELSAQKGYTYVEADVQYTRDNKPVLLHDGKIDRTSDGTGNVKDFTYEQLLQYDFGSWKSDKYKGTKIPLFTDFIKLCRQKGLRPYIELKSSMTDSQVKTLIDGVRNEGMLDYVVWISFYADNLKKVQKYCDTATLDFLTGDADADDVSTAAALKSSKNQVYLGARFSNLTASDRAYCLRKGVQLCVWTVNNKADAVRQSNTSALSITSDSIVKQTLYP